MEEIYGDYANKMKTLANEARKESVATPRMKINPRAKEQYAPERESLQGKIREAEKNAPLERQAQVLANSQMKHLYMENDMVDMDSDKKSKLRARVLTAARTQTGAKRRPIQLSDKEWEAIQAGAVGENTMRSVLSNIDMDDLKMRAVPNTKSGLTPGQIARAKNMAASGYPRAEIADTLGVSESTIREAIKK